MTTRQLTQLIELTVKKAVREELAPVKRILVEISKTRVQVNGKQLIEKLKTPVNGNNLTEIQKQFRKSNPIQQRQVSNYSSDPMLNSLLRSTEPLKEERQSYLDQFEDEEDIVNLPTHDDGRVMNAPKAVVEAMNRDYSNVVNYGKGSLTEEKNKLRANMMSIMEEREPSFQELEDEDESLKDLDQY